MKLLNLLLPVLLILLPFALTVAYFVYDKKRISAKRKNPINIDLLRNPGQSVLEKLEDINSEVDSNIIMLFFAPLVLYIFFLQSNKSFTTGIIFILSGLIVIGFSNYKLYKSIKSKRRMSLGYDAELAIGQELNSLMRDGYYVFHDFQAKNYNIDHVLVGSDGVFAVETKGRSKPIRKDGKSDFKVLYDGEKLKFPDHNDELSIEQAKRQATSLQKWLSSAVGESITVTPILAIPGWYIERTSNKGILVVNGKNITKVLATSGNLKLNEKLITQIAHQLEQSCRTIKIK